MNSAQKNDSRTAPLALAAFGLFAATAFTPMMAEATTQAEAPSISVQHEGTEAMISTADVENAGWFEPFRVKNWGCDLAPWMC